MKKDDIIKGLSDVEMGQANGRATEVMIILFY
jgi:hypothetical protein